MTPWSVDWTDAGSGGAAYTAVAANKTVTMANFILNLIIILYSVIVSWNELNNLIPLLQFSGAFIQNPGVSI